MATTSTTLDNNAALPAEAHTKAGGVTQHGLKDQIAYDRYKAAKAARGLPLGGAVLQKIIPAAAVPDDQGTAGGSGTFDSLGV